jgi:hypothetical protein
MAKDLKKAGKKAGSLAATFAVAAACIVGVAGILVGGYAGIKSAGNHIGYSEGARTGQVVKIAYQGVLCKSWEGSLAMGSFRGNTGKGTSNTFDFSINDPAVLKKLQKAQDSGKFIKVKYEQSLTSPFCSSKTSSLVTDVVQLKQNQGNKALKVG